MNSSRFLPILNKGKNHKFSRIFRCKNLVLDNVILLKLNLASILPQLLPLVFTLLNYLGGLWQPCSHKKKTVPNCDNWMPDLESV